MCLRGDSEDRGCSAGQGQMSRRAVPMEVKDAPRFSWAGREGLGCREEFWAGELGLGKGFWARGLARPGKGFLGVGDDEWLPRRARD